MVKIEGYPLQIIAKDHACDPSTVDPLMHVCLAFASCIAKWLRRYYMLRDIKEPLYTVTISLDFDEHESVSIIFDTSYENYENGIRMLSTVSEECYIGKIIKLPKYYTMRSNMYTHTICV